MLDVLVAGDLYIDLILSGFPRWPAPGEESFATTYQREIGGGAPITAHALAKLGVKTAVVGTVGRSDGEWVVKRLQEAGVATDAIREDPLEATGVTVAVSDARDRAFFTYSGANGLTGTILESDRLPRSRHIHLACVPTLRMMERLRHDGYTISVDVGWHPEWLTDPGNTAMLRLAHLFFPNEREAYQMRHWIDDLPNTVIVTKFGAAGARVHTPHAQHPGFSVAVKDTTGAGDCFNAGFLYAWLHSRPLLDCLRIGNACGALSTRTSGGVAGMPSLPELEEFLCRS